jgi:hypothetical protein
MRPQKFMLGLLIATTLLTCFAWSTHAQGKKKRLPVQGTPILWRDPVDISSRHLFYGPGSPELVPATPLTFLEEDKSGTSPKFLLRDARGVIWKVKLGEEAQSETAAVRLIWAVGYFAEEAYYFPRAEITQMPRLSRGQQYVEGKNIVCGARFEPRRADIKRGPQWDWADNPFRGKRELDGLKVLMILLNNYDIRPDNNCVLLINNQQTGELEARYTVTDLGATFGRAGGLGGKRSKNNLQDYLSTRFVTGVEGEKVQFDFHTRPKGLGLFAGIFNPSYYDRQAKKERIMRDIPLAHARWIGSLLAQLSDEQLREAFRAAGYDDATIESYVKAVRRRISQLTQL